MKKAFSIGLPAIIVLILFLILLRFVILPDESISQAKIDKAKKSIAMEKGNFIDFLRKAKKENRKYTFINIKGEQILPDDFAKELDWRFKEGLLGFCSKEDKWGFIDKTGAVVIKPEFDQIRNFSEGYAKVKLNGKWGYIDKSGKIVIEPQFDNAGEFHEGMAQVKINNAWGYIDKSGEIIIKPTFTYAAGNFSEGLAVANDGDKFGFIDKTGKWIITPNFDLAGGAGDFHEGLCDFSIPFKGWGYFDKTGKAVIKPIFEEAGLFVSGLARVKINKKLGFIDKQGEIVIEAKYADAGHFSEGLASVRLEPNGKWGYIDETGKLIIDYIFETYDFLENPGDFKEGKARVKIGKNWGFINKKGETVISPRYKSTYDFSEGYAVVSLWMDQKDEKK
ncbi:MAG TPA: hypothetical protein DET40_08750 [Lentisphaeria bacterium]|nr:MAG: hypothetical protein A2X45_19425 [Lentisphaerae bacterium GWF2_50_93]HCE43623.1 hypothetical protein [Lentisphaeria bacterium]